MRSVICFVAVLALPSFASTVQSEDWTRFRGPNGSAVSAETGLPVTWSETENLAWKLDLPGPGSSSPIVSGERVFVTCYSGYGVERGGGDPAKLERHLLCVNLRDGKLLWQKSVPAVQPEDPYQGQLRDHGYASSTPATDGQRVFVFFGKSGVFAFDLEDKQLWQTSVGTGSAMMGWGSGVSLLLYKNLVIVNANAESQSLVGLDKETGKQVWKTEGKGYSGSWSTPVLVEPAKGKPDLVVRMPDEVWGLDPDDGGLLWYCTGQRGAATTSLVAKDGIIYTMGGGPQGSGSAAIRGGGSDDVTKTHVVWTQSTGSYVPSPAIVGQHIYWVDDRGTAYCVKAENGEQVYKERLPGAGGVYASVVAGDGKIFAVTRRNGTFVLAAGPEFKVLAHNELKGDATDFNTGPAISQGRLLLRSNRCLYCIGGK